MSSDPSSVLGVSEDAADEEIRRAYLEQVRRFPPDREPAAFERVRDAYEALRDPHRRAMARLLARPASAPLDELLEDLPETRRFAGPQPWLRVARGE